MESFGVERPHKATLLKVSYDLITIIITTKIRMITIKITMMIIIIIIIMMMIIT